MKAMLCVQMQSFERRILPEDKAMELDKRLWKLFEWTATMPGAQPEPVAKPCVVSDPDFGVQVQLPDEMI